MGPLVAVAILFLSVEGQEWLVERRIASQLGDAPDTAAEISPSKTPGGATVHIVGDESERRIPRALLELPDGIHEYETGEGAWVIGLATTEEARHAVIRDTTSLEQREHQALLYALSGGALATLIALIVARRLAQRLTAPLESLAHAVRESEPDNAILPSPETYESREEQTLASALHRYQRRTLAALERERRFAADVSHELRTPLTIISNATEIVSAEPALSSRSLRAVTRINTALQRMHETTLVLLALIREPEPDVAYPAVDVAKRLETVIDNEAEGACGANTPPTIHHRIAGSPQVHAPEAVVDMIIGNLLRNALAHSQATRIDITLDTNGLRIADDGVGFPQGILASANDGGTATPADRHTGLGLSLILRLCRRFGWKLRLENTRRPGAIAIWEFA